MSSFDIGSLVTLLQSTKIKQRNDALMQLESLVQSPLNLSLKLFRVLLFSILDSITIETKIYKTKNTIATENRLIAASSYVKLIVEKTLDSVTLKAKLLIEIIRSVIALLFVDNEILIPCSVDFVLTIDTILRLGYVKDHLNYSDYNSFAHFFYKIINICTDSFEHEKLLAGAFSALHNLLQCDQLMSTNYLQLYQVYKPILPILQKTCLHYSRDNIVILICFKIINKLIIVLSTEDIVYVNGLIHVGIDVVIALHSTNLTKLFYQFLIFINLNPVYDFLTLSNSQVTQAFKENQPHNINRLDENGLLYKMSSLSQSLIAKLNTAEFELNLDDINLTEYNSKVTWFKLKSIALASSNNKAWLLYLGVSKMLSSYFELKKALKSSRNSDFEFDSSSSILNKRQKLGIIGDSLHNAYSILDFCNRLICDNTDLKTQKIGLKILVLYLQWYSAPPEETAVDHSNDDIPDNMSSVKETLSFSIASYNTALDYKGILVKNVLTTFNSPELTSWTMLLYDSLLVDNLVCSKYIQHRSLYQLLSISLLSLKSSILCLISCKIAELILVLIERDSLYDLLDKPMITQIQNIIDLSDINGPCEITNQSISLWYCLNEVIQKKNIKIAQSVVAEKVQEWLLIKWQRGTLEFGSCSKLPEFIAWLCGVQLSRFHCEDTLQASPQPSICEPFDFLEERLKLESFIALHLPNAVCDLKIGTRVNNLVDNDSSDAFLFSVINLFSKKSFLDSSTTIDEFHANIMIVSLSQYFKFHSKFHHFSNSMEQQASFYFDSLKSSTFLIQEKQDILCKFNWLFPTLREEVKQIIIGYLPLKLFSVDLLRQLQTKQEGTDWLSSNMFSDENKSNVVERGTEFDVINWISLTHSTDPLFEILESMFNFSSISQLIPAFVANLERTNLSRAVKCIAYLTNKLDGGIDLALVPTSLLNQLVRFIGGNVLVNHKFERSEIVFISVCKLLKALLPIFLTCEDEGFKKDCYDMCTWLVECDQQMVITSELASIESCKFLQQFVSLNDESFMSNEKLEPLLFDKVKSSSNFGRFVVAPGITEFIHGLQRHKQTEFYSKLLSIFPSPKVSMEASASFSLFFTKISESSPHILQLALFNMLECSKFSNFGCYLKPALDTICKNAKIESRLLLFEGIKITLLKWWWDNDKQVVFPFEFFDYPNKETFYCENYRELVAIVMSLSNNHRNGNDLIEKLAELKQSDVRGICHDSLSLAIPLAFAHHGKKSEIFTDLVLFLGAAYKQDFQERLLLVVLDIIQFTDISRDDIARELFKSDPITRELFLPKVSDSRDLSSHLTISPGTCKELLTKLVNKYSMAVNFWSFDTIYFLIRRLLLRVKQGELFSQRALHMKQLKMILVLGSDFINNTQIIELLIQGLCPIYHHYDIKEDIEVIFTVLRIDKFSELSLKESLPLVFEILGAILRTNNVSPSSIVLNKLELYLESVDSTSTVYPILIALISKLRGSSFSCTLKEIECFLQDSNLMNNWESGKDTEIALSMVSNIFPNVKESGSTVPNIDVVKLLVNIKSFETYSKGFQLWASKYISNFYLSGEFFSENCNITSFKEIEGINPDHFEARIKYMDHFLDTMIWYCEEGDFTAAAIAESIIGVLIYNYDASPSDVSKYIKFEDYYDKFKKYTVPMNLKSCLLLNGVVELESFDESLDGILKNFDQFIGRSFELWTTALLLAFLDKVSSTTKIARLISIFAIKVSSFACKITPWFISYFVHFLKGKFNTSIAELISNLLDVEHKDRNLIELLTRIVLLLRTGEKKGNVYFDDLMESIDLRKVVEVVSAKKLSKTALLLFEELHSDDYTILDWQLERKVLSVIYDSIDDEDIIHGIPEKATVDYAISMMNCGIDNFNQLKFSTALFDAEISLNLARSDTNILQSLSSNGLHGISRLLGQTLATGSDKNVFEWAWKLNRWDLPIPQECTSEHHIVYKALKQIHDFPTKSIEMLENSILSTICSQVQFSTNVSSCKEQSDNLTGWFRSLSILHSIGEVLSYDDTAFSHLLNKFANSTSWLETSDLLNSGNIMQARQVMFQVLSEFPKDSCRISNENIWLGTLHELMRYNMTCLNSNQLQGIISSSMLLTEICKHKFPSNVAIAKETEMLSQYQVATSIWSQGITDLPVVMLKDLAMKGGISLPIDNLSVDTTLINATLVGWIASSRQDLASNIMEKYVIPTADKADGISNAKQSAKVYHLLANFCEKQYKSKNLSDDIDKLEKRVSSKKSEIDDLKSHYGKTSVTADEKKQVQRFYSKLKAQYNSEVLDLQSSKESKETFSKKAVEFYLKAISLSEDDDEDEDVDKFFALWLELSVDNDLNMKLKSMILDLPSYKLISWSTQLISRLAGEQSEFQGILQKLILKMCTDHPYHTLYQLLSLKFHKDYSDGNSDEYKAAKYDVANNLWMKLLNGAHPRTERLIVPVERFCHEAYKLSEHKVLRGKSIQLSRLNVAHFWLEELPAIPPPTMSMTVDRSTNYENVVVIAKAESKVTIATSGLSLPKILTFHLSNGKEHRMLVKYGADDLRQDSIMEQVFEKVNQMLKKNKETRKRKLRIRTYKAVPMSPKSGMIEFVANSISLIDIIKPYHTRQDSMTLEKARQMMRECQSGEKQQRYQVYQEITAKVKPVLRHFYFDNFLTPDSWFDSRIVYTHGIATTSIVGHILGLGDRHCNNILLDKETGEPIHIDLGVAFDQGKRLPIPETVPFRLTRDIVDGFGVNGTNGIFTTSCQRTFEVLRRNSDHILSILDVLRWDPLYSWTISTMRKRRLQDETGGLGNIVEDGSEAGRAVVTVSDKLNAGGLSVEATVTELIQEATNPHNLALIYLGWCPFY
jgi:ataxia telangiectasia mutated family protein